MRGNMDILLSTTHIRRVLPSGSLVITRGFITSHLKLIRLWHLPVDPAPAEKYVRTHFRSLTTTPLDLLVDSNAEDLFLALKNGPALDESVQSPLA